MISLTLDPSDTRPARAPAPAPLRTSRLRVVLFALVGAGALGGFGVAASTLMAGLAAPAPVKRASQSRAADWPDLKDGLPTLAGAAPNTSAANTPSPAPNRAEPETPALRMAALPDPVAALPTPAKAQAAPARTAAVAARPTEPAAAPEAPTKRIPMATPVALIGPARQAMPLPPARAAALQQPKASETVRARTLSEPTSGPVTPAAVSIVAPAATPEKADKPARKVAAVRRPTPAAAAAAPTSVAAAEAPEAEDTEVLGIKLPSLAPAGRKLKEGVDALGEAVRNVF